MANSSFRLNYKGITELMHQPEMVAQLEEHARHVKDEAARLAEPHRKTGAYIDSLDTGTIENDPDRVTAYVVAKVPYAAAVESRDRILGRALNVVEEL